MDPSLAGEAVQKDERGEKLPVDDLL